MARSQSPKQIEAWLTRQPQSTKDAWLVQLTVDAASSVRREILTAYRNDVALPSWPTILADRTIAELEAAGEKLEQEMKRKAAEAAARTRAKRLAAMAADPKETIRKTEELVKERSMDAYKQIAKLLSDLREALAGTKQSGLAEKQALKLKNENPNLRSLTTSLRQRDFLR
jgi:molecular chaperone DnaK (HSP70)